MQPREAQRLTPSVLHVTAWAYFSKISFFLFALSSTFSLLFQIKSANYWKIYTSAFVQIRLVEKSDRLGWIFDEEKEPD